MPSSSGEHCAFGAEAWSGRAGDTCSALGRSVARGAAVLASPSPGGRGLAGCFGPRGPVRVRPCPRQSGRVAMASRAHLAAVLFWRQWCGWWFRRGVRCFRCPAPAQPNADAACYKAVPYPPVNRRRATLADGAARRRKAASGDFVPWVRHRSIPGRFRPEPDMRAHAYGVQRHGGAQVPHDDRRDGQLRRRSPVMRARTQPLTQACDPEGVPFLRRLGSAVAMPTAR